jgi:predicted HTH domain antitoxin
MRPQALTTALTLFESGTLTLPQAAARAGCSESELKRALRRRGILVPDDSVDGEATTDPVRAD